MKTKNQNHVVLIMIGIMASLLLSSMDSTVVSTSMKKIIESLGGMDKYAWPFTMYILCSTIAIIICGGLADIYGHKPLILGGVGIFLGGSMLCGISQSIMQLIIFRGIQGIGGGMIVSCVFIIIADLFAPSERGKYTGIVTSMYGLSSIIGPLAGGFITDHLGWRWVFYMNIPLGLAAFGLLLFSMPSFKTDSQRKTVDYPGIIVILLMLVPFLLAISMGGNEFAWNSLPTIGMFVFSAIMLILFLVIEGKSPNPILPLSFFKNRAVFGSFLIAFFSQVLLFSAVMYLPYFIQGIVGSTATTSGLLVVPMMLGLLASSNTVGFVVSKSGKCRAYSIIAFLIMALGAYLLSTMNLSTAYWQTICFMVILGFGIGMSMPITNVNAQNATPKRQIGSVTSAVMFFRNMGGTVGSAMLGAIMSNSLTHGFKQIDMQYIPAKIQNLLSNPQIISNSATVAEIRNNVPTAYMNYFDTIYTQAKQVLVASIHNVFLFSTCIAGVGIFCALALKDASATCVDIPVFQENEKNN